MSLGLNTLEFKHEKMDICTLHHVKTSTIVKSVVFKWLKSKIFENFVKVLNTHNWGTMVV